MKGLWDIHCHILPKVDDGADSMEEAMELLRKEYEDGVRNIILTPHFRYEIFEPSKENVLRQYEKLKKCAAEDEVLRELTLYLGTELHVSTDMAEKLNTKERLTLGDSRCVLVEYDYREDRSRIRRTVKELLGNGYLPIVAHAERCKVVTDRPEFLEELKHMGAMIQINADSITGKDGFRMKLFARKILKKGWVDFVGSDGHNMTNRIPDIGSAYLKVEKWLGSDYADDLFIYNPQRIIR